MKANCAIETLVLERGAGLLRLLFCPLRLSAQSMPERQWFSSLESLHEYSFHVRTA